MTIVLRRPVVSQPLSWFRLKPEYARGLIYLAIPGLSAESDGRPINLAPFPSKSYIADRFSAETKSLVQSEYGMLLGAGIPGLVAMYRFSTTDINAALSAGGGATLLSLHTADSADSVGNRGPISSRGASSFDEHYPYTNSLIYLGPFSGTRWVEAVSPPKTVFRPHTIVATHKSGEQKCFMGGALVASAAVSETPSVYGGGGAQGYGGNGACYLFALWNRALDPILAQRASANPWFMFAPRQIIIPVAAAASVVPTITAVSAENITATSADYRVTLDFA